MTELNWYVYDRHIVVELSDGNISEEVSHIPSEDARRMDDDELEELAEKISSQTNLKERLDKQS